MSLRAKNGVRLAFVDNRGPTPISPKSCTRSGARRRKEYSISAATAGAKIVSVHPSSRLFPILSRNIPGQRVRPRYTSFNATKFYSDPNYPPNYSPSEVRWGGGAKNVVCPLFTFRGETGLAVVAALDDVLRHAGRACPGSSRHA